MPLTGVLMTKTEVARALQISAGTVSRLERAGKLPVHMRTPGGHRRWHSVDVLIYRNSQQGRTL